jgi:hypothetical protein
VKLSRRQFLNLAASAAALPTVLGIARAQTYPASDLYCVLASKRYL